MLDQFGTTYQIRGNLPEALKSFQGSLDIADRLAKLDPHNAGWQHSLSVSHEKVGAVLVSIWVVYAILQRHQWARLLLLVVSLVGGAALAASLIMSPVSHSNAVAYGVRGILVERPALQ